MASDDREPVLQTEELLRANRSLDEQVKELVKLEQRFFQSQRALARRNARLDALNRFAIDVVELSDPREILARAAEVVFSVFALDQAVGFLADANGALIPVVGRGGEGTDADLARAVAGLAAPIPSTPLPTEPVVGPLDVLRGRPELAPLFERVERIFRQVAEDRCADATAPGLVLPISRDGGKAVGAMVFVRLSALAGYHEELPTSTDQGFFGIVARLVGASVTNVRLHGDLRRSYDQLAQAQRELVDRERLVALGEFAAIVAHEVRNPLGAIFNAVSMLQRKFGEGEGAELLEILGEESHRLDLIVTDLIDFARPNPPNLAPERPLPIVQSVLESLRGSAPAARVSIVADAELPEVLADARLLRQAIFNLLINAVQASGQAEPIVVRLGTGPGGAVQIAVEDRGGGVPSELEARIFEPFFTTKAAGTGLGLSVVKRVADAHGGSIEMSPRAGGGTVFTLTIPAAGRPPKHSGDGGWSAGASRP